MKKFVIYDQVRSGDCFDEIIEAASVADAIRKAEYEWGTMSEYDKKRRSDFFLARCELDEDGCPDMNTAEIIVRFL